MRIIDATKPKNPNFRKLPDARYIAAIATDYHSGKTWRIAVFDTWKEAETFAKEFDRPLDTMAHRGYLVVIIDLYQVIEEATEEGLSVLNYV